MAEFIQNLFAPKKRDSSFGGESSSEIAKIQLSKRIEEENKSKEDQTQKLQDSIKEKMANEPKEEAAAAVEARKKQKAKSSSALGRRSTILTSPLGIQGGEQSGTKTLLGA